MRDDVGLHWVGWIAARYLESPGLEDDEDVGDAHLHGALAEALPRDLERQLTDHSPSQRERDIEYFERRLMMAKTITLARTLRELSHSSDAHLLEHEIAQDDVAAPHGNLHRAGIEAR